MKSDFKQGLKKMKMACEKDKISVSKHFNKLEEAIIKHIQEKERADYLVRNFKQVELSFYSFLDFYILEIENDDSLIFQYSVNRKEVENMQTQYALRFENLLHDYINMYFIYAENTSGIEWKKIKNKLKLPI